MLEPAECFICEHSISSRKDRRDINGESKDAKIFKESIERFLEETCANRTLEDIIAKTETAITYICIKCGSKFRDWVKHKNAMKEIERDLLQKPFLGEYQAGLASPLLQSESEHHLPRSGRMSQEKAMKESTAEVLVKYPLSQRKYSLKGHTKTAVMAVITRPKSCGKALMSIPASVSIVVRVGSIITKELKYMNSAECLSTFTDSSVQSMTTCTWSNLWEEVEQCCPTPSHVLTAITTRQKRSIPTLCVIVAMLLKLFNQKANLVQSLLSVVLYSGGCNIKVIDSLQPLRLTVSHRTLVTLRNAMIQNYDKQVIHWKKELEDTLNTEVAECITQESHRLCFGLSETLPDSESYLEVSSYMESSSLFKDVTMDTSVLETTHSIMEEESVSSPSLSPISAESITDYDHESSSSVGPLESTTIETQLQSIPSATESIQSGWLGYKLVGDNIDKNVHPRFQTLASQNKSLHYFHCCAVKDRIATDSLSDIPPSIPEEIHIERILPSYECNENLRKVFQVLVTRILVSHVPTFKHYQKEVTWHIPHKFSKEMSQKSEVVPLGVILKNENILADMVVILQELQKYVPQSYFNNGQVEGHIFRKTIIGGDYLTAKRARGAQLDKCNELQASEQLRGLIPVSEDWHARQCLMNVIWKQLYDQESPTRAVKGSLYQLQTAIKRTNVPANPATNMNSAEAFIEDTLSGYVLAAACTVLHVEDSRQLLEGETSIASFEALQQLAARIVNDFTDIASYGEQSGDYSDEVHRYTTDTITLTLLWAAYHDATREGDGQRVVDIWRHLLLLFRLSKRSNYAQEAVTMLTQIEYLASPRLKQQIMQSRFVNTYGVVGKNIPCDLHMEHLNRLLKEKLLQLKANLTPGTITTISQCLGPLQDIQKQWVEQCGKKDSSNVHSEAKRQKDIASIVSVLNEAKACKQIDGRRRSEERRYKSIMHKERKKTMYKWLKKSCKEVTLI